MLSKIEPILCWGFIIILIGWMAWANFSKPTSSTTQKADTINYYTNTTTYQCKSIGLMTFGGGCPCKK